MTNFTGTIYIEKTTFKSMLKFGFDSTMVNYMF
jgi:hypothetical protein